MTDEKFAAVNRLRRLREHNLSSMPALIAQRSVSSFSLQRETPPEGDKRYVRVIVYPQDPFVGSPEIRLMDARDVEPGLTNSRVRIQDSTGSVAQPDENGDYMYLPGTLEFDQVNTFFYTTFTLRMYETYAQRALPWAFPLARIAVDPHAGDGANAFYNEQDRLIGYYRFQLNGEAFNAAESADIISHETGHAILDGVRDLHNESFGLGPTAFHESFGDMTAVLIALHDGSLIDRLLEWTGGDLSVKNFIAEVAEHLTEGIRATDAHVQEQTAYLRNAINQLEDAPFDAIPYLPANPETELGRESHNYSRLFTGVFYDILIEVYNRLRKTEPDSIALPHARDLIGQMLMMAVELGPVGEFEFADMARAFLTADSVLCDHCYGDVIQAVFAERKILSRADSEQHLASLKVLPDIKLPEVMNSSLAAALFLEDVVAPALNLPAGTTLTPMAVYRNAAGQAYLTYFSNRSVPLEGKRFGRFDGAQIDAFGGLALMFDVDNRLRSVCFRDVTDEDVRQIQVLLGELVERGFITDESEVAGFPALRPLHLRPGQPKGLLVSDKATSLPFFVTDKLDPPKIVKFPVLFDAVPWTMAKLGSYLRAWMDDDDQP
jgi:hypothetical protein